MSITSSDLENTEIYSAVFVGHAEKVLAILSNDKDSVRQLVPGASSVPYYPLQLASRYGRCEVVRLLLQFGAEVNLRLPGTAAALQLAVWGNHGNVVEVLIAAGADCNACDGDGTSPLMTCSLLGLAETALLLLEAGANPRITQENGNTALHLAVGHGVVRMELVILLLIYGADVNGLCFAKQSLLSGTPLHVVMRYGGTPQLMKMLLLAGGSPYIQDPFSDLLPSQCRPAFRRGGWREPVHLLTAHVFTLKELCRAALRRFLAGRLPSSLAADQHLPADLEDYVNLKPWHPF